MTDRRDFGSLYRRGRVWWLRYRLDGREYRESAHTTSEQKAQRLLSRRQAELDLGVFVAPAVKRTTFEDLAQIIRDDYAVNRRRSRARLEQCLARLGTMFAGVRAMAITGAELTAYVHARTEEGAALATVRNELNALRKAMRLARRVGKVAHVPDFPTLTLDNTRTGFFEEEDLCAVLGELPAHLRPFIRFLALTGWRAGEARALTWVGVDSPGGMIRLESGQTKSRQARAFPFAALPALRGLLEGQRAYTTTVERETGQLVPWVFHREGQPIGAYGHLWRAAVDRAAHSGKGPLRVLARPQLVGRLVHDLRRTAVRNLERAGISRSVAMQLTGHKTESVYRRYAIVVEADLAVGVEKLAAALGSSRGTVGGQSAASGQAANS